LKVVKELISESKEEVCEETNGTRNDRKRELDRRNFVETINEAWKAEIGKFFKIVNREKLSKDGVMALEVEPEWHHKDEGWTCSSKFNRVILEEIREQELIAEETIIEEAGEWKVMVEEKVVLGELRKSKKES